MTLYELLQKATEENEKNIKYAESLVKLKDKIRQTKEARWTLARKQLENEEIDLTDFQIITKRARREAELSTQEIDKLFCVNSTYGELRARLKDCGAFISNKMMCNLLKTQTGANWSYRVVEESPMLVRLYFQNDLYEKFTAQQGILSQGGNLGFVIKQLENINWFQQYLNAKHFEGGELLEMSLVTGQKGFMFPPFIQTTLENFFKVVKVDTNHPENLTIDDRRFEKKEDFKPNNTSYRHQGDKKAGKFENPDGKNGK